MGVTDEANGRKVTTVTLPDEILPVAFMRALGTDETPLPVLRLSAPGTWAIEVMGFGHLIVADTQHGWRTLLTKGPGTEQERANTIDDQGRIVCPMLHKADRLDVVFAPVVPCTNATLEGTG